MEIVRCRDWPGQNRTGQKVSLLFESSTLKNSGLFGGSSPFIPTLTFLSGDALGKELPLLKQQITIGRGEDSDILIVDPSVSRKHIRLTCRRVLSGGENQGAKVVLEDLGSKNGTLVNYRRVRRAVLRPGDKVCLGRVILKFEYRDMADQNFYDEIYRLVTTDVLTSLLNKSTITRVLSDEIIKRQRYRRHLSILLIDIDDFKSLNDTFGHLMGDRALQAVATVLRGNLRRQDKAGRFGGEELLVVLPETGTKGAQASAERIRRSVEQTVAQELGLERQVTVSVGVASYPMHGSDADNLLDRADAALYRAKVRGKNRIELWRKNRIRCSQS